MAIDSGGVELVLLLPFLAPLVIVGRLLDMWNTWRGNELPTLLESASEADWANTWGRMLSSFPPAPHPTHKT